MRSSEGGSASPTAGKVGPFPFVHESRFGATGLRDESPIPVGDRLPVRHIVFPNGDGCHRAVARSLHSLAASWVFGQFPELVGDPVAVREQHRRVSDRSAAEFLPNGIDRPICIVAGRSGW